MILSTITLWTLIIWAEPNASSRAMTVATVPGFATEKSCQAARDRILMENASRSGRSGTGPTGIDIKLITCIPVEYEKETQ
jgi:hypothetical protein